MVERYRSYVAPYRAGARHHLAFFAFVVGSGVCVAMSEWILFRNHVEVRRDRSTVPPRHRVLLFLPFRSRNGCS